MSDINALNQLIADRMLWLRLELFKMTQEALAKTLQVTHQHIISGYEHGKIKPGTSRCMMLIELAKKHGKKIDMKWLRPDLEKK